MAAKAPERSSRLTVAICFLNERDEVRLTVESVRDTAGDDVEVLLVNDASTKDFDYEAVAQRYGCRYVENRRRLGPAASRTLSVDLATTRTVLLLDAHMRFYAADWHRRIEEAVISNPNGIFSMRCPPLDASGARTDQPAGIGASVHLEPADDEVDEDARRWSLFAPRWNVVTRGPGPVETVPCVLGGAYAFDRAFFIKICGHLGLQGYGGEEPYLSIKAWLAGGSCHTLTDVEIGHIYRQAGAAPFTLDARFGAYNKMVLLATVIPERRFEHYRAALGAVPGYRHGVEVFRKNQELLRGLRSHLQQHVFTRPFTFFERLNRAFADGGDVSDRAPAKPT